MECVVQLGGGSQLDLGVRALPVEEMEVLLADGDGDAHAGHERQNTAHRSIRLANHLSAGGHERAQAASDEIALERYRGKFAEFFTTAWTASLAAAQHRASCAGGQFGQRFLESLRLPAGIRAQGSQLVAHNDTVVRGLVSPDGGWDIVASPAVCSQPAIAAACCAVRGGGVRVGAVWVADVTRGEGFGGFAVRIAAAVCRTPVRSLRERFEDTRRHWEGRIFGTTRYSVKSTTLGIFHFGGEITSLLSLIGELPVQRTTLVAFLVVCVFVDH